MALEPRICADPACGRTFTPSMEKQVYAFHDAASTPGTPIAGSERRRHSDRRATKRKRDAMPRAHKQLCDTGTGREQRLDPRAHAPRAVTFTLKLFASELPRRGR